MIISGKRQERRKRGKCEIALELLHTASHGFLGPFYVVNDMDTAAVCLFFAEHIFKFWHLQ